MTNDDVADDIAGIFEELGEELADARKGDYDEGVVAGEDTVAAMIRQMELPYAEDRFNKLNLDAAEYARDLQRSLHSGGRTPHEAKLDLATYLDTEYFPRFEEILAEELPGNGEPYDGTPEEPGEPYGPGEPTEPETPEEPYVPEQEGPAEPYEPERPESEEPYEPGSGEPGEPGDGPETPEEPGPDEPYEPEGEPREPEGPEPEPGNDGTGGGNDDDYDLEAVVRLEEDPDGGWQGNYSNFRTWFVNWRRDEPLNPSAPQYSIDLFGDVEGAVADDYLDRVELQVYTADNAFIDEDGNVVAAYQPYHEVIDMDLDDWDVALYEDPDTDTTREGYRVQDPVPMDDILERNKPGRLKRMLGKKGDWPEVYQVSVAGYDTAGDVVVEDDWHFKEGPQRYNNADVYDDFLQEDLENAYDRFTGGVEELQDAVGDAFSSWDPRNGVDETGVARYQ